MTRLFTWVGLDNFGGWGYKFEKFGLGGIKSEDGYENGGVCQSGDSGSNPPPQQRERGQDKTEPNKQWGRG